MNFETAPLNNSSVCGKDLFGSKANVLAKLAESGFRIPAGFAIGAGVYAEFLSTTGIKDRIIMELARKRREDMRWEELWDASLRIKNFFIRTPLPEKTKKNILKEVAKNCSGGSLAVRSSSLSEDGEKSSYAGIHDSYIRITGEDSVLNHVKLVWASLFSDRALAYSEELSAGGRSSAMCVIIQDMIEGEKSGVAFGVNPGNQTQAVIECVPGLNSELVDGKAEPYRIFLSRKEGRILEKRAPGAAAYEEKSGSLLEDRQARAVFSAVKKAEEIFGSPQDMEWTFREGKLYILQARPITAVKKASGDERLDFDLSLRRSFDSLKTLGKRIREELIPKMTAEAERMRSKNPAELSDKQLSLEINNREEIFAKWKDIYWAEFIPFAHGVRLFGEIYNERVSPKDPYEFLNILSSGGTESLERNNRLHELAHKLRNNREDFESAAEAFIRDYGVMFPGSGPEKEQKALLASFLQKLGSPLKSSADKNKSAELLEKKFINTFIPDKKPYARELTALAKESYAMRDDDNIYLGRIEKELNRAVEESKGRLGDVCAQSRDCKNYGESIRSLKEKTPVPSPAKSGDTKTARKKTQARQLRGQSAASGIVRGKARVVKTTGDLFLFRKNEILVCDSIDPNMTFVIPLASGVVERRGGMLVHGAIIAREYGIPCVTGIPDASELISTGDDITVDGYFGLVTKHSQSFDSGAVDVV